jgi:hypothetical protein
MGHILIPVHNSSLLDLFTVQLIRQHCEMMFFMKLTVCVMIYDELFL